MRCRDVGDALLERELGLSDSYRDHALKRHIAGCTACAARASAEADLSYLLVGLQSASPPSIDVTRRVMRGIAALSPRPVEDVSPGQLGWATAAAVATVVALLAGLWRMLPTLADAADVAWTTGSGLGHTLGAFFAAAVTLASSGIQTATRLLASLAPIAAAVRGLEPVAIAVLALSAAVMVGTIVLVVGRDLRTPALQQKGTPI